MVIGRAVMFVEDHNRLQTVHNKECLKYGKQKIRPTYANLRCLAQKSFDHFLIFGKFICAPYINFGAPSKRKYFEQHYRFQIFEEAPRVLENISNFYVGLISK